MRFLRTVGDCRSRTTSWSTSRSPWTSSSSSASPCPRRSSRRESDRILERAQEEADRIIARAQEQAAFLIEERELTRAAEERSRQIVDEGHAQADEIRRGADEYAAGVLIRLEGEVVKVLQSIKRGIALLDERAPAALSEVEEAVPEAEPAASHAQL
jgi:hypothetical protein